MNDVGQNPSVLHTSADKKLWVQEVRDWGGFVTADYAKIYPDLRWPTLLLRQHYFRHGMFEDRIPNSHILMDEYRQSRIMDKVPTVPLIIRMLREDAPELRGKLSYLDPNAGSITGIISDWGGFDPVFYLRHNPDVVAQGKDAFKHFCQSGIFEYRDPNEKMNVREYCINNENKNFFVAPAIFWMIRELDVKKN